MAAFSCGTIRWGLWSTDSMSMMVNRALTRLSFQSDQALKYIAGPVRGVAFHPSRPLLVTGGDDYKIKVWGESICGDDLQTLSLYTLFQTFDPKIDDACSLSTAIWITSERFSSITKCHGLFVLLPNSFSIHSTDRCFSSSLPLTTRPSEYGTAHPETALQC